MTKRDNKLDNKWQHKQYNETSRKEVVHIYRSKKTPTVSLSHYEQWGKGIGDKYKVEARTSISDS